MRENQLKRLILDSLDKLIYFDHQLFTRDISERSLTARWMHHLQILIPEWNVDVEFNREGNEQDPKRLGLEESCINRKRTDGTGYVVPDLIIHRRDPEGPNLFIAEIKKSTNKFPRECDHKRIIAFRREFNYEFGALIELETRKGYAPGFNINHWYDD